MHGKKRPSLALIPGLLFLCLILAPGCAKKVTSVASAPMPVSEENITGSSTSAGALEQQRRHTFETHLEGELGSEVSQYIEQFLMDSGQSDSQTSIQENMQAAISSKAYSSTPKADIIITGEVFSSVNDQRGSDMITVQEGTGQFKTDKSLFGEEKTVEIKRSVMKPVPTIVRQASLTVEFIVLKQNTDKVLLKDSVQETLEDKYGGGLEYKDFSDHRLCDLPSREDTLDFLAQKASEKIAKKILALP